MATLMTEAVLRARLQAKPDSLVFSRLADLYRKSGNIAQAIDLCLRGVEEHPDYVTGRLILGRCYLEQENLDKAVDAFVGVCRIDRRNIVALKMLADIFMRQGFREKAGDLFALLTRIDPYNEMLARSAAQTRGSGKRDLFEILGIDIAAVETPPRTTPVTNAPETSLPEVTQIVTPQELGIESAPPAGSGSADATAATELAADVDADEVLAEATELTGSDITERMTRMFGEEHAAPSVAAEASPPSEPTTSSAAEATVAPETPVEETIEVEPLTEVPDGNTITSRIDELFGKDTLKMPAIKEVSREEPSADVKDALVEELLPANEAAFEETMIVDADAMKLSEESGISLKPVGAQPPLDHQQSPRGDDAMIEELVADEVLDTSTPASGEVAARTHESVEELFKGVDESSEAPSRIEKDVVFEELVTDVPEPAGDDTLSGDDVSTRIGEIFDKKTTTPAAPSLPVDVREDASSVIEDRASPAADNAVHFEELVTDDVRAAVDTTVASTSPSPEDTISGKDVEKRIEEVFEGAKRGDAALTVAPGISSVVDETRESSNVPSPEDTISGKDIEKRIEEVFEQKNKGTVPDDTCTVSLGRPGARPEESAAEATIMFEKQEGNAQVEEPDTQEVLDAVADREALEEVLFEIKEPEPQSDASATVSTLIHADDTLSGDDVTKRTDDSGEKNVDMQSPAETTGTATEMTDDTEVAAESVIETVGILTGNDVEERLNDFFKEAKTEPFDLPVSKAPGLSVDQNTDTKTFGDNAADFEETLIAGDLDDLLGPAEAPKFPFSAKEDAAPSQQAAQPDDDEETLNTRSLDDGDKEIDADATERRAATAVDMDDVTAVFEDFTPGSVPQAPPPAPEVPLFLTGSETSVDSDTVIAALDKNDSPYDIPDHVLTPTLADLYFQQGQPALALSIYRRLLQKSGGNERFKQRIQEIEAAIADGSALQPPPEVPATAPKPKKKAASGSLASSRRKKPLPESDGTVRPLSGVRLKKRPKIVWRKKSSPKQ